MIELRDVSKRYETADGPVQALASVTLSAQAGELVAVRGHSGCGKTTLLLSAGGLLAPDSGQVAVLGRNVYGLSARQRAELRAAAIGFVFQQFHLVPYLTVLENVLAPSLAVPAADAARRASELVEHFGLSDRMAHLPAKLSTGERQRVALARAMLNHPRVILADEPTGNLDEASTEIVLRHLADFAAEGGTVLLVTHDQRAAEYASRTLRMERGRLAES